MSKFLYQMMPAMRARAVSERSLSERAGVSRMTLRAVERGDAGPRLASYAAVAGGLGRNLMVVLTHDRTSSDSSTVAAAYKIARDGFESWKIHIMDLVDEFRRTLDSRLLLLPPPSFAAPRTRALMASVVRALCREVEIDTPDWALRSHFLDEPWFVANSESLKASALLESPLEFRQNNIFVLSNFLERV